MHSNIMISPVSFFLKREGICRSKSIIERLSSLYIIIKNRILIMNKLPLCPTCGQNDEYLIDDNGCFTCLCGHSFYIDEAEWKTQITTSKLSPTHEVPYYH